MKLDGRVALVTGAQQGIGRATAEALGHAGASVIVNFLDDHEAALQVVESIQECGSSAKAVKGDVGLRPDCEEMMAAGGLWGGVDLLINNAGIFPRRDFLDLSDEDWNRVQNVNVMGGFRCLQLMARELIAKNKPGTAVNLASVAFFRNSPKGSHYAASKGAIIGFTRSVSTELAPHGIRVNAIAPGIVDTAQPRDGMTEEQIATASQLVPLGAMAEPKEIADVAVFLSSNDSRHITGQTLQVNGGTNFS
jgi:NAD(P)-dependent dehydrogenase (short-subunit alcohol dehydrogenase family)|tara:strand:+ start:13 stop:762 length:750 start_codon:yes stop_codon:yes gene_type:complete